MTPKFPNISVDLTAVDSNAYSIMGAVTTAMRRGGCSRDEQDAYRKEAMSGDYDNLIQVSMRTVNVTGGIEEDEDDQ